MHYFEIVRMSHPNSNMCKRFSYVGFGSEILHLARTASSKEKFQKLITILLARI